VPGPLLRRALVGGRGGTSLVAGVVAVALLCAARAAPALIIDATADRAFAAEVARVGRNVPYDDRIGLRAYATGLADDTLAHQLETQVDRLPVWGPPVASYVPERYEGPFPKPEPVIRRADGSGPDVSAVIYARTGAIDTLTTVDGRTPDAGSDGVWVPEGVAAELGVRAGDRVELELVSTDPAPDPAPDPGPDPETPVVPPIVNTVVAGVYVTADTGLPASDRFDWSSIITDLPNDPASTDAVAALVIVPVARAIDVAAGMGDTMRVIWDSEWEGPFTIDRGRMASRAFGRLAASARDPFDGVGVLTADAGIDPLRLASGATTFVERSEQTADALGPLIESMAVAIQVIAAGLVAGGVWLLATRRRREVQLALSHGMHPAGLGVVGAAEQLAPIVLGTALTWLAVDAGADLAAGTGSVSASVRDAARATVLQTAPWVLVLAFAVWTAAAASVQPVRSSVMKLVAPALRWEVIVTVLAVATGYQLASEQDASGSSTALLFPILAVLSAAALVALLVGHVVRRLRSRSRPSGPVPPRHLGWWLMGRRVAAGLADGAAVIVVVATGVALLGYTSSAAAAADAGVDAKAAVLAGARNTAVVPWSGSITGTTGMPTGLPAGWTIVWHDRGLEVGAPAQIDIVVVDPATFADAAVWRRSFADRPLLDLLAEMAAVPDNRVGIVTSGFFADRVPASGTMSNGLWTVPFQVVARVEALPGLADRSTMAMVDATRLFALLPPNELPYERVQGRSSDNPDGNFRTSVWSSGSSDELVERLADVGLGATEVGGTSVERARPDLVAYGWSLPVLRFVGWTAVAIAVLAMLMHVARRRSATVLDVTMLDELGVPRRSVRVAVIGELVAAVSIGSVVGVLLAGGLARFMIPRLDPARELRPRFVVGWSVVPVVSVVGLMLAAAAAVSVRELRACGRARRSEVFRA
jgi:hypothetical protein